MQTDIADDDIIADINMTPLVDVSLVLVIIFMIISPFLSNILKPIILPTSRQSLLTEQNTIKVSIFPDGQLGVGPRIVNEADLESAIGKELAAGKKPWVLVRAGAEVSHGRVMSVVKTIKKQKIERVAFATRPRIAAGGSL
mgnify:CR=1 FL=1